MDGTDGWQCLGGSHESQTHSGKDEYGLANYEIELACSHRSRPRRSRGTTLCGRCHYCQSSCCRTCARGRSLGSTLSYHVPTTVVLRNTRFPTSHEWNGLRARTTCQSPIVFGV